MSGFCDSCPGCRGGHPGWLDPDSKPVVCSACYHATCPRAPTVV